MSRSLSPFLTFKQKQLLQYIEDAIFVYGYPPTQREMADHFGWKSTNAANDMLHVIEKKGYINVKRDRARAIEILKSSSAPPSSTTQNSPAQG